MNKTCLLYFLVAALVLSSCHATTEADYLIQHGKIVDGLGNPALEADLAIRDGVMKLVKPGEKIAASDTINARGLIVSPGFVDAHNHSDRDIVEPEKRLNEVYVRQGVTTVVGGPDGMWSPTRMKELIASYDSVGIGTNVALYVGHNGIRREVMRKDQQRLPTTDELDRMKALVREGMELGAVGFSTGLMYEPGMYSDTDEVIALAKEVAPYDGTYDSHVRNPVFDWIGSNQEVIEIGRSARIPAKMGHLKAVGLNNAGKTKELVEMTERARNEGIDLVSDQYPYDGAGGKLTLRKVLIPTQDRETNNAFSDDQSMRLDSLLALEEVKNNMRSRTENGINDGFSWVKAVGYTGLRIVDSPDYPELAGKFLSEIAEERGVAPFDLMVELERNARQPVQVKGGIAESDVTAILVQPWNMIASDGLYVEEDGPKVGHPRSTGTFPKVLGTYVREQKLLTLEEAIRKMTSFPADFLRLYSRGRIEDNLPADVVIFDPQTITDRSTYAEPNIFSEGMKYVFVNGSPVLWDGEMTGNAPGKFLKREEPTGE